MDHELLRECRKFVGMTQDELGKVAGVNQATVSHFERDKPGVMAVHLRFKLKRRVTESMTSGRVDDQAAVLLGRIQDELNRDLQERAA